MQSSFLNSLWQSFSTNKDQQHDESAKPPATHAEVRPDTSGDQDQDEGDVTPTSTGNKRMQDVPSFALSTHEPSQDDGDTESIRVNGNAGPPNTTTLQTDTPSPSFSARGPAKPSASSLMPPPSMKAPTKSLPSSDGSLRIPSNGPLPNRGPPANSQQRAGSSGRGKVLLAPGHSPMDWASLARSKNLSGVPALQRVTPSQMKVMNGRKGNPIWSSYQGKVYNVTPYLPFHPGGEKELMKAAGRDGTKLFMEIHPWVNWEGMLSSCLVGILVSEEEAKSSLDSLD